MIEEVQIATNRYAPPGAQAINMYLIDGEQLTLGQLTIAVCIKAGANMEAQNVSRIVPVSALGDSAYIKFVLLNKIFSGLLICSQSSEAAYNRRIKAA